MRPLLVLFTTLLVAQAFSAPFEKETIAQKLVSFVDKILHRSNSLGNTSCTESCCATLHTRPAMTYHYYQNTGRFKGGSGDYAINTVCYSGQGEGYNNPAKQCVSNVGPLPATTYKLATCVNVMH